VTIDGLDLVDVLQHVRVGVALHGEEPVHRVDHVVRCQFAAVDGSLVVPPYPLPQLEDIRRLVRLTPRLGEVSLDREGAGLNGGPRFVLEQPAVGEGVGNVRLEGDG
jgi:hypothetical protein